MKRSLGRIVPLLSTILTTTMLSAQDPQRAVQSYVARHQAEMVAELRDFLSIPNVASDLDNIRRNAAALVAMMEKRGISARLIQTGGPPLVYGEIGDASLPTILFYCHYDGQPTNAGEWSQASPWSPVLRAGSLEERAGDVREWPAPGATVDPDWRIYARSASDDKAPIVALMYILDAWRATGLPLRNRLKFLFEGDEEAGSQYLPRIAAQHRELLAADLVVMADGPIHPSGRPTADFGLRGLVSVRLTTYGPSVPVHSGHYGNWIPNPAMRLAQLLASMKAPDGTVLVAGWEDDVVPLAAEDLAALAAYPHDDHARRAELWLGAVDGGGVPRLALIARPSLNVRGLASMYVGAQARTVIPDRAVAELDLRLVAGNRPERQVEKLVRHIEAQGFTVVRSEPDSATRVRAARIVRLEAGQGYPAGRTSLATREAQALVAALRHAGLGEPVVSPTMGGSGPAYVYTEILGAPFVVVPTVNHDNNQHAGNENVRLGNVFRAVEILSGAAMADLRPVP